jgi:membrane fusion protein, multidrug efflux system
MTQHRQIQEFEAAAPTYETDEAVQDPFAGQYPLAGRGAARKTGESAKAVLKRFLVVGVSLAALGAAGYFGQHYWTVGRFEVSTDDAYVKADSTAVAPRIAGYVAEVLVGDNEPVKAGQMLARIDDRDFKVALEQARADVEAARAAIGNKQAAIVAQQSAIEGAKAAVESDAASQTFAEQENKRYADLAATGFGSQQNAQGASARVLAARANVARERAALDNAVKQLDVLKAEQAQAQANLLRAQAAQDQASLNLSYTAIVAPVDGTVGNRSLRVGQFVQAGTLLMAVVPTEASYVVANFKETQLTEVHPGQSVEIEVDMFPGQLLHGRVDSVAPASGQEFAVLPPDNATGNFTKVVQRIPVKITLDAGAPAFVLRPGMSVTPTIDTRSDDLRLANAANARS